MRPLLIYATRHRLGRALSQALIHYDIKHLKTRYDKPHGLVSGIRALCQDRPPAVVMAVMPGEWEHTFITQLAHVYPRTQVVRAAFYAACWQGRFYVQMVDGARVREMIWRPE